MRFLSCWSFSPAGLVIAVLASSAVGLAGETPKIGARQFVGGSAKVTVSGSAQFDQDIAINTQGSIADGEMTWLQFGASGSETPNALVTYAPTEIGINVGRGKFTATAGLAEGEAPQCQGKTEVTKTEVTKTAVSGQYTCRGIVSFDASTGKMGKVDIIVRFAAKS